MAGRLAKILEQEYKTKGLVGGTLSAGGKRLREIVDLRNVLFSGSGLGSVIGKKIFGKGYSATGDRDTTPTASKIVPTQTNFSPETVELLSDIKRDTRISSKNSIVLPQIARDMNLTKLNIMKLVRLQGDTAEMKADMFFKRSGERERLYESQFGKKSTTTTPTLVNKIPSGMGFEGMVTALLAGIASIIALNWEQIEPYYKAMKQYLYEILGAMAVLYAIKGALSIPRPIPTPGGTPGPAGQKPTPVPTPGGQGAPGTPGAPGGPGGKGTKTPTPGAPGGTGAGGAPPSGPTDAQKKKLSERLAKLLKSPKAWGKFVVIAGARGVPWIISGILASGPVGWIITAILFAMAYNDIMDMIDEAFKEDEVEKKGETKPTSVKQQQSDMANLIYDRFIEAGFSDIQARAAVANAKGESTLNPNAHNTKNGEDSVGLFQMNRNGNGLGKGYTVEQLKDPEFNIQLAIAAAKKSKAFTSATSLEDATSAFVKDIEKPKFASSAIKERTKIAQQMASTELGTKISTASTQVADAKQATSAPTTVPVVMPTTTTPAVAQPQQILTQPSAWDRFMLEDIVASKI